MKRLALAVLCVLTTTIFAASVFAETIDFQGSEVQRLFAQYADLAQSGRLHKSADALQKTSQTTAFEPLFVISAAGNAAGARGTFFKSDVVILNGRNVTQEISVAYFPANTPNQYGGFRTTTVPAGGVTILRDIVGQFFNNTGLGAIVVLGTQNGNVDMNAQLAGFSRIWTPTAGGAGGTTSQSFPAIGAEDLLTSDFASYAIGARQDASFRANLGIFNFSSAQQNFQVNALALQTGTLSQFIVTVPAYSLVQVPVPSNLQGDLLIGIPSIPGSVLYNAYVSTTDNTTGDSWSANLFQ